MEDVLEASEGLQNLDDVLNAMPVFLHRITPTDRFFLLPQSFKLLTGHRAYRSLAVLFQTYGARESVVECYSRIINTAAPTMEPIHNDSYQQLDLQVRF